MRFGPISLRRVSNRWPAIMLAVNRTVNVMGRIMFLIDSIQTIKGIKTKGVPWGTKWVNMWLVFLIHPYNRRLNHSGNARVKLRVKCLVAVKM